MSLYSILKYLEPFLIYHKDLSFKQYETINAFIDEKIKEFKANYVKQYTEFKKAYANVKPRVNYSVLLDNATNNIRNFYDSERDDNISDIELINKMNSFDNGKLFSLYLAKINAELMVPESVNEFIENKAPIKAIFVDTADGFLYYRLPGTLKMSEIELDKVYSVRNYSGEDKVIYTPDTLENNWLTAGEMKFYLAGQYDAMRHYRKRPVLTGFIGVLFGGLSAGAGMFYGPIGVIGYTGVVGYALPSNYLNLY
jgi:hypothetical protein